LRILVVSDFHGSIEASKRTAEKAKAVEAMCIVVCGDLTHFGSVADAQTISNPLISQGLPVLYVPGNCDPAQLAEGKIKGAINLHGQCYQLGNVSLVGIGGAPASPFYSWYELSETQIMNILEQSVDHCSTSRWLAVVSHSPPKDTLVDLAFSKVHAGSVSLRAFIEGKKPSIVFCGHIHEARGIDHLGNTIIVNPGPVRHGNCAIANLDGKIEVTLDSI